MRGSDLSRRAMVVPDGTMVNSDGNVRISLGRYPQQPPEPAGFKGWLQRLGRRSPNPLGDELFDFFDPIAVPIKGCGDGRAPYARLEDGDHYGFRVEAPSAWFSGWQDFEGIHPDSEGFHITKMAIGSRRDFVGVKFSSSVELFPEKVDSIWSDEDEDDRVRWFNEQEDDPLVFSPSRKMLGVQVYRASDFRIGSTYSRVDNPEVENGFYIQNRRRVKESFTRIGDLVAAFRVRLVLDEL